MSPSCTSQGVDIVVKWLISLVVTSNHKCLNKIVSNKLASIIFKPRTQPQRWYTNNHNYHLPLFHHRTLCPKQHAKPQVTTSKPVQTKTKTIHPQKKIIPPTIQAPLSKPTTLSTLPPVPLGILRKSSPVTLPTPQKEVRKSLVNPHLKIPQTLPLLDLPPPDPEETLETYKPPDESLFSKPLPVLKDAKELDVFTRHIPKQTNIDKF